MGEVRDVAFLHFTFLCMNNPQIYYRIHKFNRFSILDLSMLSLLYVIVAIFIPRMSVRTKSEINITVTHSQNFLNTFLLLEGDSLFVCLFGIFA